MHKWLVVLHVTANLPYDDHDHPRAANAAENTKCGKFAARHLQVHQGRDLSG
jgi:hypothetical protein